MLIEPSFSFEGEYYGVRITLSENADNNRVMILIGSECIYNSHTVIIVFIHVGSQNINWNIWEAPKNKLGYVRGFSPPDSRNIKDFISEPAQKLVEEQFARVFNLKLFF